VGSLPRSSGRSGWHFRMVVKEQSQDQHENEMMMKLLTTASSEIRKWILGFIATSVLLCGCVTTRPYDIGQTPHQDSISDFIMRWDALDRRKAALEEYRELYAQTLKALISKYGRNRTMPVEA
jgi:hypothetical protein